MGKVVTSEGLQGFIETGKPTETIPNKPAKAEAAPALETKVNKPADAPEIKADAPKPEVKETEDTGLEPEDHDLADRAKRRIGKKHYEMKVAQKAAEEARAEAAEAERFAETLFNERESWRVKAEELQRKTAELEAKITPPSPALTRPDPNQYTDDKGQFRALDYAEALAEYSAKKAVEDDRKTQAEQAARVQAEAEAAVFKKRIELAEKKYPDWTKAVTASQVVLQNECLQYIAQSEYGTDLAYYLAKNPEVAEKIKALHPIRAIAELGKLETSFEKPATPAAEKTEAAPSTATSKTVERSGAPAPITPISTSGTGSIVIDPAKMDFKQLRAYERERAKHRN